MEENFEIKIVEEDKGPYVVKERYMDIEEKRYKIAIAPRS